MKISTRHRTTTMPLAGVTFTAAEKRTAMEMARALAALPPEAVAVIKDALAYSAQRLTEVGDWTTPNSDQEVVRSRHHDWTLTAILAAEHAPAARAATDLGH